MRARLLQNDHTLEGRIGDLQMVSRESVVNNLWRFYDQEHPEVGAFACQHQDWVM